MSLKIQRHLNKQIRCVWCAGRKCLGLPHGKSFPWWLYDCLYANQPGSYNLANWVCLKSLREAIYNTQGKAQADIKKRWWEYSL